MLRTYRYRLYPNKVQREQIRKNIDACRFVYNWALEQKKLAYETDSKCLSWYDLNYLLTSLKQDHSFLKEAYSQSLIQAIKRVILAYKHFFRESNLERTLDIPNLKAERLVDSLLLSSNFLMLTSKPIEYVCLKLGR